MEKDKIYTINYVETVSETEKNINIEVVLQKDDILKVAFEYSELVEGMPEFTLCWRYGNYDTHFNDIYDYVDGFVNKSYNKNQH